MQASKSLEAIKKPEVAASGFKVELITIPYFGVMEILYLMGGILILSKLTPLVKQVRKLILAWKK
ncbi:hypothetical protein NJT12_04895 [Flavobacterium sp. AC]|uniref:Uncharacterized protein n=1 Tax=Flavobacterium azizsancarii TaxID=2961580 RepID=A0ABT4W8U9_9FLAO|nr:hypothetical protein [Flavobacterium azizsancarii]MDA6068954.1 hypothetical protein [Flavobacterium azizsancarii]